MYIRILENDDWIVEYDAERNQYRVDYFQDYHLNLGIGRFSK